MKALKRTLPVVAALAIGFALGPAQAETPEGMPWFMDVMPQAAKQAAWDEFLAVYGDNTEVPAKYKELVALAVSAQIPCDYCIYFHNRAARQAGASEEEIREALAVAAMVRKWSTMLNGSEVDFAKFKDTIDGTN